MSEHWQSLDSWVAHARACACTLEHSSYWSINGGAPWDTDMVHFGISSHLHGLVLQRRDEGLKFATAEHVRSVSAGDGRG